MSIEARLNAVLSGYTGRAAITQDDTPEELDLDSLDIVEVLLAAEEEFGADIDLGDWDACKTVADMRRCIEKAVGHAA